jgi:hypothetical protein
MPVTSINVFSNAGTQYDLRQAVMWALISPTEVRVNYRGAPGETWIKHDLASWVAAKQTSLGTTLALSPHIFNIADSYWDLRFAAMWTPSPGGGVRVYYEAANEYTWVDHPSLAAWEARKQLSINAGG